MYNTKCLYYHHIIQDFLFEKIQSNLKFCVDENATMSASTERPPHISENEWSQDRRSCNISWIECNKNNRHSQELFNIFWNICKYTNEICNWNFDIEFLEDIQYTVYSNKGDKYDWHTDVIIDTEKYIRKISMIVLLDDNFTGGEFQLETKIPFPDGDNSERYETIPLKKGSILVFHSDIPHRVKPVLSGTRKSLVIWANGPYFK